MIVGTGKHRQVNIGGDIQGRTFCNFQSCAGQQVKVELQIIFAVSQYDVIVVGHREGPFA